MGWFVNVRTICAVAIIPCTQRARRWQHLPPVAPRKFLNQRPETLLQGARAPITKANIFYAYGQKYLSCKRWRADGGSCSAAVRLTRPAAAARQRTAAPAAPPSSDPPRRRCAPGPTSPRPNHCVGQTVFVLCKRQTPVCVRGGLPVHRRNQADRPLQARLRAAVRERRAAARPANRAAAAVTVSVTGIRRRAVPPSPGETWGGRLDTSQGT